MNKKSTYDAINGLIGRILMQDIHQDGFKQITFSQLDSNDEELEEGLLDQIVSLT